MFENRVFKKIFGLGTIKLRMLHGENLHDLYRSHSIVNLVKCRGLRWVIHVAKVAETRNTHRNLVGKSLEGQRKV